VRVALRKSTSGRIRGTAAVTIGDRLVRAGFAVLNHAPLPGALWAEELFFTPGRRPLSPRVREFLSTGRRRDLRLEDTRIATWEWGAGPTVALVHGWEGVGGQLAAFAPPLVAAGFRVVTFDAPGHGAAGGRRSSLVHFARALRAVVGCSGEAQAVIAHSLGAAATTLAMAQGVSVRRAVFIGATAGPRDWTEQFVRRFGIADPVMARLRRRTEQKLGLRWEDLDVVPMARRRCEPLLVIHDRHDAEVPWSDGAAIAEAWPGAELVTTAGLGHRRILRDATVVARSAAFVAETAATAGGSEGVSGYPRTRPSPSRRPPRPAPAPPAASARNGGS
jgi:pimeloyl-ACP methyl ester carboxylesterase